MNFLTPQCFMELIKIAAVSLFLVTMNAYGKNRSHGEVGSSIPEMCTHWSDIIATPFIKSI